MSAVVSPEDSLNAHLMAVDYFSESNDPPNKESLAKFLAQVVADARGRGEAKGWEAAMRMEHPWSLLDVLRVLCLAVDHLLGQHGCDDHGHEETKAARDAGREILEAIARRGGAR